MNRGAVPMPDVVGELYTVARQALFGAGFAVTGVAPDGSPVADDSEGLVVEQDPLPLESIRPGQRVGLRVGRPPHGSGDREPLEPPPLSHEGHGLPVDPSIRRERAAEDPSADPTGRAAEVAPGPAGEPGGDPDLVPA